MASIYRRPVSQNFCLSCFLRPGAKLIRASLGTDDDEAARKVARKVDLLIEQKRMSNVEEPKNVLADFDGLRGSMVASPLPESDTAKSGGVNTSASEVKPKC